MLKACEKWLLAWLARLGPLVPLVLLAVPSAQGADGTAPTQRAAPQLSTASSAPRELIVAVPDAYLLSFDGGTLETLFRNLNQALAAQAAPYRLSARAFQASDAESQLAALHPDFVFAQASVIIAGSGTAYRAYSVATRKVSEAQEAAHSVGGVILVNNLHPEIKRLEDLRNTVVGTTMQLDTGWLAVLGEIAALKTDPEHFFSAVRYLNTPLPNIFSALATGAIDAAVIDTCVLERVVKEKLVDARGLRILNEKTGPQLDCARSTALYSDATLYAFEWTDEQAVRAVLAALLSTDGKELGEWHVHVSRAAMDELLKTLRLGPYEYLRSVSWEAFLEKYRSEILLALILIGVLIVNEFRLHHLVKRRTAELSEALSAQRASEREARTARLRLGSLERRNVVNQMSAMIAHEIRTPLGAITNFASVLRYLFPEMKAADSQAGTAMEGILKETAKIAGIVDRVRQYAKSQRSAHVPMDLAKSVRDAERVLAMTLPEAAVVTVETPATAPILGDALECELLVFNLLKNAVEAASQAPVPEVMVTLAQATNGARWVLSVENSGLALTDEAFERLGRTIDSVKPEGLGMGLSIVRGIADSHAALMHFYRRAGGGLRVEVSFDQLVHSEASLKEQENAETPDRQTC